MLSVDRKISSILIVRIKEKVNKKNLCSPSDDSIKKNNFQFRVLNFVFKKKNELDDRFLFSYALISIFKVESCFKV